MKSQSDCVHFPILDVKVSKCIAFFATKMFHKSNLKML